VQPVFVRKVAVNSGGKHCLALSSEGEVYTWGEAEDGKLGHGNRRSAPATPHTLMLYYTLYSCSNTFSSTRSEIYILKV